MDGRGRDIRLSAPHGLGHSSSFAPLFRSPRVRSSSRLEPRSIQSHSRSGIPVPDSDSFVRKMFFSSPGPEYLVENFSFPQMRWPYYRKTIGIETIGLCYKVPVGLCYKVPVTTATKCPWISDSIQWILHRVAILIGVTLRGPNRIVSGRVGGCVAGVCPSRPS